MNKYIYILCVFFVVSCQDIQPVEKPSNLIDRSTMKEILYEIAVVNAARGINIQKLSQYGVNPETYIFEKFAIDSVQFAKSVSYYSSDIESYRDMYLDIQKRVDSEYTYQDSLAKIEKKVKDSIRTERARELQREKDSIKKVDSLAGKKETLLSPIKKRRLPVKVVKEIVTDSL
ncbi:DUF4296 domain-containing protein [Dokdonia ponticola]|uniref:DUF4296 domain-containing protein n=1 Tax=Dokdonia ponticola TaxID=2041041 RepID=A0ABV9I1D6_9FLAO